MMMGDTCISVSVECEYEDYDSLRVTDELTKRCVECHREIPPGAPHIVHTFLPYEPEPDEDQYTVEWQESHRECLCCASVRDSLFAGGWIIGCVWEMIATHMDDVMPFEEDDGNNSWLEPPTAPIKANGW
jgi:hypothetical protein